MSTIDERIKRLQAIKDREVKKTELKKRIAADRAALKALKAKK